MKKELPLSGPLDVQPGKAKVAAFVGPTGVGKTTTVAKLAALEALSNKKKVALVSIDNYRIAALEQLRIYATIMDLPFKAVSSPEELERTIAHFADKDLILIDTAGRSQRDHRHLTEIKQFLRQSFPVEIYLVMSVTHKENNLSAISQEYGLLPIDRLIFSKLDESCTYGTMLNQLARINKPLSYLTTGQKVPEDIEIATQERIVSLLLGETEIHYC
jgi:flagellar biosynthesis protein FlhF